MQTLKIKDLSFGYDRTFNILKNINLTASSEESIGIIGANGVGKSTLLKLLVGLQLSHQGSIQIENLSVEKKQLALIRKKIGYVFQDSEAQLFMSTVFEEVAFGPRHYGLSKEEVRQWTEKALRLVEMEGLKDQYIHRLSGGQKKLVSIATILAMDPSLILLDEPSVALDPKHRRNLIHLLNHLNVTKLIASHDLDFIYDTCERTILLWNGEIVKDGKTKDILTDEALLEAHGLELPLSLSRR